ncbi:MAG: ribose transport system ATP-binding protein [Chthoniobacter sp.]|jgi:rhamnose transport system ATP-binding protein|nr:ribose transport system ATP-binding protein [Chthoniobacter sp.]
MPDGPLVALRNITKTFGGVHALSGVTLEIAAGEIHALCGENGAGKSTLIKILSGSVQPDSGEVLVDGSPLATGSVAVSEAAGIAVIHQEIVAFPHLSAQDNIFIGREPRRGILLDRAKMRSEAQRLLNQLGEDIDLSQPVGDLPVAQQQMVGMARALSHRCRLLIMDEPTASLSARETTVLFRIIRQLQSEGVSILYVSHRLEEIFALSNHITVLRDGRWVATEPTREINQDRLIQLMVGRELAQAEAETKPATSAERVLLEVRGLKREGVFDEISLQVRAGEIVGMAGLVGAGRSEVAQSVFNLDPRDAGEVLLDGEPLPAGSVRRAMQRGLALVPEDRQHAGLVLPMSVGANLSMASLPSLTCCGLTSARREDELIQKLMRELVVKAASPKLAASSLSGGNQQKLVLGKWLARRPKVLILDEPTRGVDVGAKAEIYRLIRGLAAEGMGVLLISSDLPEVLSLSDRILIMREGRISGELSRTEATQEKILALAIPAATAQAA